MHAKRQKYHRAPQMQARRLTEENQPLNIITDERTRGKSATPHRML